MVLKLPLFFKLALPDFIVFTDLVTGNQQLKHVLLSLDKFLLEVVGLDHSVTVQMVLKNLLLDDILAELEQIDAMDEVLF